MKYVYIVLIVALFVGGYFVYSQSQKEVADAVPEGFHRMEDGSLMSNDAGMEMEEEIGATVDTDDSSVTIEADLDGRTSVTLDPNARVFKVTGVNHKFDVTEITVNKGETVTINFESTDGFHDWVVDEFDAATAQVRPSTPTSVTFVADEAGTFEYYCAVGNHRAQGMIGKLIVVE